MSPSSDRQFPLCASTHFCRNILDSLGTKQIHGSTRPNTTGDSQETSTLPQRAPKYHCTMVRSRLHRRRLARTNLWICRALPHRHSSVFYVFLLNDAAISWRASRTALIVIHAAEAELYILSSATQEAIYVCKGCIELGFLQNSPTIMYADCQVAVAFSKENKFCNCSKHISLRWSFVVERQSLTIGIIAVVCISRTGMLTNMFCSPRPASSFIPFRNTTLGHTQMPIALLITEERDASYSILVHAVSEYPTVRYRAHPSIDML